MNRNLRTKFSAKPSPATHTAAKPSLVKKAAGVIYDAGSALAKYTRKLFWLASTGWLSD